MRQNALAAHFKVTEQAVSQWVRNESAPDFNKIFELSKILEVRAEWLSRGTLPRHDEVGLKLTVPEINIPQWISDVPILGAGSCGNDGMFELNGQTIGHAKRPPHLQGAKGVYAIYVYGDSMAPWRENGGMVYVHPNQPVKINDYVVVQIAPEAPGATPAAYIKRLVRRTADHIVLLQYNPREELKLPTRKVQSIHRIMDWDELLGG